MAPAHVHAASGPLALLALLQLPAVVAGHGDPSADPGWELLVTDAGAEVPRTCFSAPRLPSWANGSFVVSGPAMFEVKGYKFQSLFDGLGRTNKFETIGDKKQVCYTSAWLQTDAYEQIVQEPTPKFGVLFEDTVPSVPSCPMTSPLCHLMAPNDNNWVNMIEVGGEGLLLSDTYRMIRMNVENLNCYGPKIWADASDMSGKPTWGSKLHVPLTGSAHPLQRPGTDTWVGIIVEAPMMQMPMMAPTINVYTFQGNTAEPQNRPRIATLKAKHNQYFHSFGVTPNYIVLPFNLQMSMPPLLGKAVLLNSFSESWDGIHLVDFTGKEQVFDTDPFFHVHTINSFENDTGVTVDLGVYAKSPFSINPTLDIMMFKNRTLRNAGDNKGHVRRLHMHLSGPLQGKTTYEDFPTPGRSVDFFKINMARSGLPYCFYYAVEWWHDGENYSNMAILKHDICKDVRTYWHRDNFYPGEPFFVPSGSGVEDDGVVVFDAVDGQRGKSVFVVLDGRTFEELEVVELPVHIPFTAHGQFVPGAVERDSLLMV